MRAIRCLMFFAVCGCSSTSTTPDEPTKCLGVAVDLQTDPKNCGTCGLVCSPDVNDVPLCESGTCVAKCHDSNDKCISGPHAQATCDTATGCSQKCDYGFRDLDGQCANGCELEGTGGALANWCSD